MSWINHINDIPLENEVKKCPKCNTLYYCSESEQTPGFRDTEYDICPYCNSENGRSMTYEYYCRKLSNDEICYLKNKGIM